MPIVCLNVIIAPVIPLVPAATGQQEPFTNVKLFDSPVDPPDLKHDGDAFEGVHTATATSIIDKGLNWACELWAKP